MYLNLFSILLFAASSSAGPIPNSRRNNVLRRTNDGQRRWVADYPELDRRQAGTGAAQIPETTITSIPAPSPDSATTLQPTQQQANVTTVDAQTTIMTTVETTMQVTAGFPPSSPAQTSSEILASTTIPAISSTSSDSTPASITIVFVTASPTFTGAIGGYTTLSQTVQQNQLNLTSAAASTSSFVASTTFASNVVNGLTSIPLQSSSSVTSSPATAQTNAGPFSGYTVTNMGTIVPGLSSIPITSNTTSTLSPTAQSSVSQSTLVSSNIVNGLTSIRVSPFPPLATTASTTSGASSAAVTPSSQATETIIVPPDSGTTSSSSVATSSSAQTTTSDSGIITVTGSTAPSSLVAQATAAALSSSSASAPAESSASLTPTTKATNITSDGLTVIPITPTGPVVPVSQTPRVTPAAADSSIFVSTLSTEPNSSSKSTPQAIVTPNPTTFQTSCLSQSRVEQTAATAETSTRTHHRKPNGTTTMTSTATTLTITVDASGKPDPATISNTVSTSAAQGTQASSVSENQQTQITSIETRSQTQTVTATETVNLPIIETVSVTQSAETATATETQTATITQMATVRQTVIVGATTVTESVVLTAT